MNTDPRHIDLEVLIAGECSPQEFERLVDQLGSDTVQRILSGDKMLRSAVEESVLTDPRLATLSEFTLPEGLHRTSTLERILFTWGPWIGFTLLLCGMVAVVPLLVSDSGPSAEFSLRAISDSLLSPIALAIMAVVLIVLAAVQWMDPGESL